MENIILFLALFTGVATAVQVSLFRRWWQRVLFAAAIAAGAYLFYPTAIGFGRADVEDLLADEAAMLDLSTILVLEAVAMLVLALFMLRDMYVRPRLPWRLIPLFQYLPAATAIGVLGYYEVLLYQQGLDREFGETALVYGGGAALAVLVAAGLIEFSIPMRLLRLELKLAMHAAQIALAVAISVLTATYPYRGGGIEPDFAALSLVAALFVAFAFAGYRRHGIQTEKLLAGS